MNTKEVLLKAAELGRKHGVASGTYNDKKTGGMCINGLLGAAILGEPINSSKDYTDFVEGNPDYDVAKLFVSKAIFGVNHGGASWGALANWNNETATSADVINALERAAEFSETIPA